MIVGEIRNQIDGIWNDFWSGGLSNPLSVMEQITYLLFIKRLDELQTVEERKAVMLQQPLERRIFPEGRDGRGDEEMRKLGGRPYDDLRWSRFKGFEPKEMFKVVDEHVFPFIREVVAGQGDVGRHMKEARNAIPTASLLDKVVEKLGAVKMDDRDTKGDVYEYMLGKIASAGQNGQFRTPRHIIKLMVELTEPTPGDTICDPACGTCGFLVAAGEFLREKHPEILRDPRLRAHFHNSAFHGFDFDPTMLRIGSMNMILHGIENPVIEARDSLSEDIAGEKERYSLVLANPPFGGSLDYEATAKDLQQVVKTKKTELLFLALFLRLLKAGGRAAVTEARSCSSSVSNGARSTPNVPRRRTRRARSSGPHRRHAANPHLRYAKLWGIDLDDELDRQLFNLEVKFMTLAHAEAEDDLPFSERIDLEAFAEKWRPATYAEALRALAEDIRREREGRALRRLGPGFKTIPGGRS
jgi:type I restriction enzyme M protein